jgi:tetratricopeptide (TPR) repeat protein
MKILLIKFICLSLISSYFFKIEKTNALIPYYYLPTKKNLEKESLSIGKYAYQLIYFGQIKDGLNLAKLAVSTNKNNEKLWMILSEAQIANSLYEDALKSLKKAEKINSNISEIYFSKSNIYLKQSEFKKAKIALKTGLKVEPENHNAIFQLGNIFLMEKDYTEAINFFDEAVNIKPDFWQSINNKALAYFEKNKKDMSIKFFKKAISIEKNAEPLLGLATCLMEENINLALKLAKEALDKNPNYVEFEYRKEQLWGDKIQRSAEILLNNTELRREIAIAKSKINKTS